jgi:hypothetical protein
VKGSKAGRDGRKGGKIRTRKGVELTAHDLKKLGVSEKDTHTMPSNDLRPSGEPSG